jgi:hypothetical protein
MSANQACFSIATMARVLGVFKAGYYAWVHRPPSAHAVADAALLKRVRTAHATSRQTYGPPASMPNCKGAENSTAANELPGLCGRLAWWAPVIVMVAQ